MLIFVVIGFNCNFKRVKMTFYRGLRNGIGAGLLGLMSLMPGRADAGVKGDLRYFHGEKSVPSYLELNLGYDLPLGVKGWSWMEFFTRNGERFKYGRGYLGKTTLTKTEKGNGLRAEIRNINKPVSQIGFGVQFGIPLPQKMSKRVSGFLKFLPLWINDKGKVMDNRVIAGYIVNVNLPYGFNAGSFGEVNIPQGLKSTQWAYGEIIMGKRFRNFNLTYNPVLLGTGNFMPKLEHRVTGV